MRPLALVLLLPSAHGSTVNPGSGVVSHPSRCRHGTFDTTSRVCDCYEGWSTAGITDTIDFLEGVCEQYRCSSDSECVAILGIAEATCPVKNWNCYCGFKYSVQNWGHGFETMEKGGGECMGVMYTFSVWMTHRLQQAMSLLWQGVLVFAILALPFGQKRLVCDHHWPSLWNGLRNLLRIPVNCHGACIVATEYSFQSFKDDIAWTLYVLDVGTWLYVFVLVIWVITLFIWSVVLWAAVALVITTVAVVGMCATMGDALGGLFSCECSICCNCCCCEFTPPPELITVTNPTDFYWSGSLPTTWWSYEASRTTCLEAVPCRCCAPLAWLIFVFPVKPDNAWGGLCGYFLLGTHQRTPTERLYTGGSAFIESLRVRSAQSDLHGDEHWRARVRNFLLGEAAEQRRQQQQQPQPQPQPPNSTSQLPISTSQLLPERDVTVIGRARVVDVDRPFDFVEDACIASSFEDYQRNQCWICMGDSAKWDLWLSCRHLFCHNCSREMLQRRMPCPLCRVSSSVVLRGNLCT